MKKVVVMMLFIFLASAQAAFPVISDGILLDQAGSSPKDYITYYGSGRVDDVKQFGLAFLESNNYNQSEIGLIKESTIPVCYVTIGEDDSLHIADGLGPGGYASWYLDSNGDNRPDQNPYWGSYYVNASNQAWQDRILNEITPVIINEKGCSGLFLDTIDTIDLYPSTAQGMISLISQLREKYHDNILVANRGFTIIWEIAPYIDGVMFESFSSSLVNNRYLAWSGDDLAWTSSFGLVLREVMEQYPDLIVFALDYANPTDQVLVGYDYNRALDFGFIPYVSTINLDNIYFHSYTRQVGKLPDGFSDPANDVRKGQIDIISVNAVSDESGIDFTQNLAGQYSTRAYYGAMLDTDYKYSTGYKSYAFGADYLIEGNQLYRYSGNGETWDWTLVKPITQTALLQSVSWRTDYDSIGSGYDRQIAFAFYAGLANEQDTTVRGKINTFSLPVTTTTSTTSSTTSTSTSIEITTTIQPSTTTTVLTNQSETTTSSTTSIGTTIPTSSTSSTTTTTSSTTSTTIPISVTKLLIPTVAFDRYGNDQVSPDSGSLDGTVDLSDNVARWLTSNGEYVNVTSWNSSIQASATISRVIATCEVDFVNSDGGYLFFARNSPSDGWSWPCSYDVTAGGNHICDLYSSGIDTYDEINNLDLACIMIDKQGPGAPGFSVDSMNLRVDYTI